jgi:hypothetical protein
MRKNTQNQVRSGTASISNYLSSGLTSWYNLRLLPANITPESVQRVIITPPADSAETAAAEGDANPADNGTADNVITHAAAPAIVTLTRFGNGWTVNGADADTPAVESYIRAVLEAEGDDFAAYTGAVSVSRIVLELGDGSIRTIRLGPPNEENRRFAIVSGSSYVYSLAPWAADRLFREDSYFERQ